MMSQPGGLRWRSGRAISRIALIAFVLGGTFAAFTANSETSADSNASTLTLIVSRGITSFKEGSPALFIEPTLVLEGAGVTSATVAIASADLTDSDQLAFTNNNSTMGDIAGTYNAGTFSLTGTATVVQWRNALRAVTFYTNSTSPTSRSNSRTIEWSIVDSTARTKTGTTTFTIDPMNEVPTLDGFTPIAVDASTTTFLAPNANVTDTDSSNFNGGNITITGAATGDVLSIDTAPAAVDGAIRSNGEDIEISNGATWSSIGIISGGTASTLIADFTSTAVTPTIARSVLRAIRVTVDSTEQSRTFVVTVNDGDGGTSRTASINFASSPTLAVAISLQETSDSGVSKTDLITRGALQNYQAYFSKSVSGVATSDFSNVGTSTSCNILSVSENTPGIVFTVSVSSCSTGSVVLKLAPNSVILNAENAPADSFEGLAVLKDSAAPTVTLSTTTAGTTSGTVIDFVLAGNEAVNCASVDKTKFVVAGLRGLTTPESLGDGSCGFSGISSVAPGTTGSSGISGVSGISIADLAGNTTSSVTGAPIVTVDRSFPVVTSMSLKTSSDTGVSTSDGVSKASTLEYDVSFSESVVGVTGDDFRNDGTATGCEFTPSASSGNSVVVAVTSCSEGTVVLVLNASTVTGAHGDGPVNDEDTDSLLIDRIAPIVNALTPIAEATAVAVGADLSMTFSEPVTVSSGDVIIRTSGAVVATIGIDSASVSGSGTNTVLINPATNLSEGASYYVLIDATALTDAAGNSFAGISSPTTWRFQTVEPDPIVVTTTTLPTEVIETVVISSTTTTAAASAVATTTTSFVDVTTTVLAPEPIDNVILDDEDSEGGVIQAPESQDAVAEQDAPTTTMVGDVVQESAVQEAMQESGETNVVVLVIALMGAAVLVGGALQLLRKSSR